MKGIASHNYTSHHNSTIENSKIVPANSTRPSQNHAKICIINARSLRNKFSDLKALAFADEYDIIGVSETWINTDHRDYIAEYSLPGYSIFNSERIGKIGGGVLMYIKTELCPILINKPAIRNIDSIYVQIKSQSHKKLILALTYRPPAQTTEIDTQIYDQIADIICEGDTIIFGDFN